MSPRRRWPLRLALALAALGALAAAPGPAVAQEPSAAERLAERHAPIVVVRDQEEACDRDGEPYRPVPVETFWTCPRSSCAAATAR